MWGARMSLAPVDGGEAAELQEAGGAGVGLEALLEVIVTKFRQALFVV